MDIEEWKVYRLQPEPEWYKPDPIWLESGLTPPRPIEPAEYRIPLAAAQALLGRAAKVKRHVTALKHLKNALEWLLLPHPRSSNALVKEIAALEAEVRRRMPLLGRDDLQE